MRRSDDIAHQECSDQHSVQSAEFATHQKECYLEAATFLLVRIPKDLLIRLTLKKCFSFEHSRLFRLDVTVRNHRLRNHKRIWIDNEANRRIHNRMRVDITLRNLMNEIKHRKSW